MKQLILVRHAQAETDNNSSDLERNLTVYGKQTARLVAKNIVEKRIKPQLIISSPANRAKQTAVILATEQNYPLEKIATNNLLYSGFTSIDLLNIISKINNDYNCIMIISHNPDLSTIANNLLISSFINFKPSTTIGLEFNVDDWSNVRAREGKLFLFEQE
ncbi:MAG: histidine phosphatase family protein [Bacteroidales bacterium]|nr:histidine phosphatase family protein [Bacteroidales bacterium]